MGATGGPFRSDQDRYNPRMRSLLPVALISLIAGSVQAQTFYLGTEADHDKLMAVEGSTPDALTGRLLSESETDYTIRVEGGELTLPKTSVWKVEGTAPTIASIEDAEQASRDVLAAADEERRAFLSDDAEIVSDLRARAAEASFAREPELAPLPADTAAATLLPAFDPVIGLYRAGPSYAFELEALYRETGDPALRRLMRRARRMR